MDINPPAAYSNQSPGGHTNRERGRLLRSLETVQVEADKIREHPRNPRKGDVEAIKESMQANGVYRPVIVQKSSGYILAGNHTYRAMRELGETLIPVVFVDVDDDTATRILLADNKTAELAKYDDKALAELLENIPDLDGTGFDERDLQDLQDLLASDYNQTGANPVSHIDKDAPIITKPGDLWLLGSHRLLCADSTDPETYYTLMQDTIADCMWTDPPYGVNYQGNTADKQDIKNDGKTQAEAVIDQMLKCAYDYLKAGSGVYICHADTQINFITQKLRERGYRYQSLLIWVKNHLQFGRADYQPMHEFITYSYRGGYTGRLGRGGDKSNWFGGDNETTVREAARVPVCDIHPTMKPVELIEPMLKNSAPYGGIVLDPFSGSGSTIIAAEHANRKCYAVELDERYTDAACARFQAETGIMPVLESTGESTDFLES